MTPIDKIADQHLYPLVSVIIPFYQQDAYLALTVRSVLAQTYPAVEIIVVDDGSPCPASELLTEFEGVKVLRTVNQRLSAARNHGIRNSSGQLLIFLDSDDLLCDGAIEAQVRSLHQHPECALSFGAVRRIDANGNRISPILLCRPRADYFPMLLESNPIACPAAAIIRRSAVMEAGLFDTSLSAAEDYWLYLNVAHKYPIVRLNRCVAEYRSHPASMSANQERQLAATLLLLDKLGAALPLTSGQQRALEHGRRRWIHNCRRQSTLTYRVRSLYYSFRAMLGVSWIANLQHLAAACFSSGLEVETNQLGGKINERKSKRKHR